MKKINLLIAPLLIILVGFVPDPPQDLTARIIEGLKQYLRKYPQEKVFVQSDRDHYVAGQTVWMKFYQFHAHYDVPLSLSGVIHVDIVNDKDSIVLSAMYPSEDGLAQGSLKLPAEIDQGHYRLRAYTQWMTNFDHQYIYEKDLFIGTVADPQKSTSSIDNLKFFPEGGALVNNIMSRVVVSAQDQNRAPLAIGGWIINEDGDTLQVFDTDEHGLGSFTFQPQAGIQYQAQVLLADSTTRNFSFPDIQAHGMTLNVTAAGATFVRAMIQSSPKYQGDSVVVTILSKGQIYFAASGKVTDQPLLINFPKTELPAGISTITVFDEDGQAQCQRSLYIQKPAQHKVTVNGHENPFNTRQAVNLKLKVTKDDGTPLKGNYSVKIADANIPNYYSGSLVDFLDINSELSNPFVPGNLSQKQLQDPKFIDMVLMAQPVQRFLWEQVLSDRGPATTYEMESSGFSLKGRVTTPQGPVSQRTVMLSSKELPGLFRWGVTDEQGNFTIRNLTVNGTYPAVLKLNDTLIDHSAQITPLQKVSDIQRLPTVAQSFELLDGHPYLHESETRVQAGRVFDDIKEVHGFKALNRSASRFYGEVDKTVELDEFIELPDMEEVFRELLPGVRLRDRDGSPEIRVVEIEEDYLSGDRFTRYQDEGPLMLINNVPVFDPALIVTLDPSQVTRIDIVYGKRSIFGENVLQEYPFKGILAFTTREQVVQESELKAIHRFELQGMQPSWSFAAVNASEWPANTPDLRDLLYWEASHTPDDHGEIALDFYTSDLDSDYYVEIQGITDEGQAVYHREILKVKYVP